MIYLPIFLEQMHRPAFQTGDSPSNYYFPVAYPLTDIRWAASDIRRFDRCCLDKSMRKVMDTPKHRRTFDVLAFKREYVSNYSMYSRACRVLHGHFDYVSAIDKSSHFVFFKYPDTTLYYTYRYYNTQKFFKYNSFDVCLDLVKTICLPL